MADKSSFGGRHFTHGTLVFGGQGQNPRESTIWAKFNLIVYAYWPYLPELVATQINDIEEIA